MQIEEANIYTEEEVRELNEKYWSNAPRETLDPIVNRAEERFKALDENAQITTKSSIKGFLRTYPFIAAVMPFKSTEWEMLDTYFSLLIHKLPRLTGEDFTEDLLKSIDFDKYRLIKNEEKKIELENKNTEIGPIPVGTAKGVQEPDMKKLSDILNEWNNLHFSNVEKAKEQLEELPERLRADEAFVNAARNSNKETAMLQCAQSLMMIVAGMLRENTEFCRYYLDNPDFMAAINKRVFESVYGGLLSKKLENVEDDKDIRNLIFNRLQMDHGVSDMELQREVIDKYGVRYGGMSVNDWRHIIEAYTPMVRQNAVPKAEEISMQPEQIGMAADSSFPST
jgi:type I restriction enzyme R subunit